jgi:hypothetical protein
MLPANLLASGCDDAADDGGGSTETAAAEGSGDQADGSGEAPDSGPDDGGTASADEGGSDAATSSASASGASADGSDDDATTAETSADSTGAGEGGGRAGGGTIDVVLSGCAVDLGGTVVVSYNGSLGVASVYDSGATLTGSFQFDLAGAGVYALSSQHRVDTGTVVNLVDIAQGTWTNLDSDALAGRVDTIGGTLTVHAWDPASGVSDLELDGVSLLNVVDGNVCTIDGTIVTTELYP